MKLGSETPLEPCLADLSWSCSLVELEQYYYVHVHVYDCTEIIQYFFNAVFWLVFLFTNLTTLCTVMYMEM